MPSSLRPTIAASSSLELSLAAKSEISSKIPEIYILSPAYDIANPWNQAIATEILNDNKCFYNKAINLKQEHKWYKNNVRFVM